MLPSFYKNQQNKKAQSGQAISNVLIIASILALGLIYLIQIGGLVGQDYAILQNKKKLEQLGAENKKLKVDIAQLQSLPNIQGAVRDFGMLSAGDIDYLKSPNIRIVTR